MLEKIKAFFSTINKKDAIILGVVALVAIVIAILLFVFVIKHIGWIIGIGAGIAVVGLAIWLIVKKLKGTATPTA